MKRKLLITSIYSLLVLANNFGQNALFYNDGNTLFFENGAILHVEGDITNANSGTFDNAGTITLEGDWTNNAGNTTFINSSLGTVNFAGTNHSIFGTDVTRFFNVTNTGNSLIQQSNVDVEVEGTLFLNDVEWATVSNELSVLNANTNAIQRNTGFVSSSQLGGYLLRATNQNAEYLFPVGSSSSIARYRPVILTPNDGNANSFGVRFANVDPGTDNGTTAGGASGPFDTNTKESALSTVHNSFYHNIYQASGSSAADIDIYHFAADGTFGTVAQWQESSQWEDAGATVSAVAGVPNTDGADRVASLVGHTDFMEDPFALASIADFVSVCIKAILGGAYNPMTGLMRDDLRGLADFPLEEPFTNFSAFGNGTPANPFTHQNGGGGETIPVTLLDDQPSSDDDIVDWAFLELRSKIDTSVVATRSALFQRDGDIVDTNGLCPVGFPVVPDDYFVAIKHRNHQGVMTRDVLSLSTTPTSYDFTNISTPTFGQFAQDTIAGINPISDKTVMYGGAGFGNGDLIYQGPNNVLDVPFFNLIIAGLGPGNTLAGYNTGDFDLNGEVKYQGPGTDLNIPFFNVLLHPTNTTFQVNKKIEEQIPDK